VRNGIPNVDACGSSIGGQEIESGGNVGAPVDVASYNDVAVTRYDVVDTHACQALMWVPARVELTNRNDNHGQRANRHVDTLLKSAVASKLMMKSTHDDSHQAQNELPGQSRQQLPCVH
jgi:hypothetical protein